MNNRVKYISEDGSEFIFNANTGEYYSRMDFSEHVNEIYDYLANDWVAEKNRKIQQIIKMGINYRLITDIEFEMI